MGISISLNDYRAHKAGRAILNLFGKECRAAESLSDVFPFICVCNAPDAREMTKKLAAHTFVSFVSEDDDRVELPNPATDLLKGTPLSAGWRFSATYGRLWVVRIRLLEPFRFIDANCRVGPLQSDAELFYWKECPWGYTAPH